MMKYEWIVTKIYSSKPDTERHYIHEISEDNKGFIYFSEDGKYLRRIQKKDLTYKVEQVADFSGTLRGIVWDNDINVIYLCSGTYNIIISGKYEEKFSIELLAGNIGERGHQDGDVTTSLFGDPWRIAKDKYGNLYVTEEHYVRKINVKEKTVETIAGCGFGMGNGGHKDGEAKYSELRTPLGLCVSDDGTIYVADCGNFCIRKIKDGIVSTIAGPSKCEYDRGVPLHMGRVDGPASEARFTGPSAVALDFDGNLLICDNMSGLRKLNLKTMTVSSVEIPAYIYEPYAIYVDKKEWTVYVSTRGGLYKMENTWKWRRFLWIGHLKESSTECLLAALPREIVKELDSYQTTGDL